MKYRQLLLIVTGLCFSGFVYAQDDMIVTGNAPNGKKIYEAKCVACHISLVGGDGLALHTRANRRIKTAEGLLGRVNGCNHQIKAGLNEDQINDVVGFLYDAFYKTGAGRGVNP